MSTRTIDLLCELLLSSAVVVNRPAVRKQLLDALGAQGVPEALKAVLIQGFSWRDLAKDLQRLVENQSEMVYTLARADCLRGWEAVEEKRRQREAWETRWDTSYWTPGHPIYDRYQKKT